MSLSTQQTEFDSKMALSIFSALTVGTSHTPNINVNSNDNNNNNNEGRIILTQELVKQIQKYLLFFAQRSSMISGMVESEVIY